MLFGPAQVVIMQHPREGIGQWEAQQDTFAFAAVQAFGPSDWLCHACNVQVVWGQSFQKSNTFAQDMVIEC